MDRAYSHKDNKALDNHHTTVHSRSHRHTLHNSHNYHRSLEIMRFRAIRQLGHLKMAHQNLQIQIRKFHHILRNFHHDDIAHFSTIHLLLQTYLIHKPEWKIWHMPISSLYFLTLLLLIAQ